MPFDIADATPVDGPEIVALLPRLGAFPRPEHRARDTIHASDARVIRRWIDGDEPHCAIVLARGERRELLGFALVRMQPDVLNGEPSAHLETLVVAEAAEGQGVGSALMAGAERTAVARGARTMSLHVFSTNERARSLYERNGYVPEWLRYIKTLG